MLIRTVTTKTTSPLTIISFLLSGVRIASAETVGCPNRTTKIVDHLDICIKILCMVVKASIWTTIVTCHWAPGHFCSIIVVIAVTEAIVFPDGTTENMCIKDCGKLFQLLSHLSYNIKSFTGWVRIIVKKPKDSFLCNGWTNRTIENKHLIWLTSFWLSFYYLLCLVG